MANYFYIDANGQKRGPLNGSQLQALATRGDITPTTPLETDTGHQGVAGQIPGLKFKSPEPPPFSQMPNSAYSPDAAQIGQAAAQMGKAAGTSVFAWLFDFAFRDIRVHLVVLWICRIAYVFSWIVAVLLGLWWTYLAFRVSEATGPLALIAIPFL